MGLEDPLVSSHVAALRFAIHSATAGCGRKRMGISGRENTGGYEDAIGVTVLLLTSARQQKGSAILPGCVTAQGNMK